MQRALTDYSLSELEQQFAAWGAKPSHAARVLRALYRNGELPAGLSEPGYTRSAAAGAVNAVRGGDGAPPSTGSAVPEVAEPGLADVPPSDGSTVAGVADPGLGLAGDATRSSRTGEDATGASRPQYGADPRWRLPHALLERLRSDFARPAASLAARQVAADGTTKLLLRLADAKTVEAVLMPDHDGDRAAGCISSQVGCAMRCDFCATTKTGFERNLTAGEIVEQFLALRREAAAAGRRLQTIVFMGMGEPMLNLDAVLAAVRRMADNRIGGLGWRQVTISTVGIVPGIDALTASGLNVNLAVSLHAPDDATRVQLLPTGRGFPIAEILAAADRFQASRGGRPVTIQYCLLQGVNDSVAQARLLARVLNGRRMHVNLLRYNPTGLSLQGRAYTPTTDAAADAFIAELRQHGVVTHFRRSRGPDIDAACGQLRRRHAMAQ